MMTASPFPAQQTVPLLGDRKTDNGRFSLDVAGPNERLNALSLLMQHSSESARIDLLRWARKRFLSSPDFFEGLLVARSNGNVVGATWAQKGAGNQASLWCPHEQNIKFNEAHFRLFHHADEWISRSGVRLAFFMAPNLDFFLIPTAYGCGFHYVSELARFRCKAVMPSHAETPGLEFEPVSLDQLERLCRLSDEINSDSLDCPAMKGLRRVEDTIHAHLNRDGYHPSHWFYARHKQRDVGCVLLSKHESLPVCELTFMGLAPDARGMGWGKQLLDQAHRLAIACSARWITLTCDISNSPAMRRYRQAGFQKTSQTSVFVKPFT